MSFYQKCLGDVLKEKEALKDELKYCKEMGEMWRDTMFKSVKENEERYWAMSQALKKTQEKSRAFLNVRIPLDKESEKALNKIYNEKDNLEKAETDGFKIAPRSKVIKKTPKKK